MSTYFPTQEQALSKRKWLVVDAAGVPLGRVASQVAALLRGKHKVTFTPHNDTGDFVVVLNASKVVLTGNKLKNKIYRHYTNYIGGLKEYNAEDLLAKSPEELFTRAVKGMLPRGPLGYKLIHKLKVYSGGEHPHKVQNPEQVKLYN